MRPFLLWRSDWPVVGQHLCGILCCVACSGALGASLSTMRAFSIMRLSVFCCARWVEGICSCIACCWSTLRVYRQKLLPFRLSFHPIEGFRVSVSHRPLIKVQAEKGGSTIGLSVGDGVSNLLPSSPAASAPTPAGSRH